MQANLRRYSMPSAGIYDRVTGFLFRKRYDAIAREIVAAAPPNAAILDAGCGPGEILVRVARLAPSLRLTGLDVDAPMIERARGKARRARVSPTLVVADAAAMPFADASFDLVVSSFAVHHWHDPQAGLAEVMRVLKPGGRALIWDIASPQDMIAAHASATSAGPHGAASVPAGAHVVVRRAEPSGPSWLSALRMLRQFSRIEPQKFEFAKPATA